MARVFEGEKKKVEIVKKARLISTCPRVPLDFSCFFLQIWKLSLMHTHTHTHTHHSPLMLLPHMYVYEHIQRFY